MKTDIVIVGGGVIGLYSAALLANNNLNITLIDQGPIGKESSWAAGGMLSPLLPWNYSDRTHYLTKQASHQYALLAESLNESTGIDIEYWKCGLTSFHQQETLLAERWCAQNNTPYSTKYPTNIDGLKPSVNDNSITLPDIAQVRSSKLIKALVNHLSRYGVNLMPNTKVQKLKVERNRIIGAHTSAGFINTEHLIWSTGAWASLLKTSVDTFTPEVTPVRGQIIVFDGKSIGLQTILYEQNHYLIPRKDGLILAGSTIEHVGFDKSITESARDDLMRKSLALIPKLQSCELVHHWSGLRPYSKSELPIIGPHPEIEGLYLNCGHYRYGIAMAPRSAEIVTKNILSSSTVNVPELASYALN